MLAFFTPARLTLKVACPGAFAWNVIVNTAPSPLMPAVPGGREAVRVDRELAVDVADGVVGKAGAERRARGDRIGAAGHGRGGRSAGAAQYCPRPLLSWRTCRFTAT